MARELGGKMGPRTALHKLSVKARGRVATVLGCGLSPHKLSLTLCFGVALGVMPLAWGTTLLCVLLASRLRLNQAAMLAVNYLCYPLQLALFLPFCHVGEFLFPWGPAASGEFMKDAVSGNLDLSLSLVAWATARALGAWLLIASPLALLAYPILKGALYSRGQRMSEVAVTSVGTDLNA